MELLKVILDGEVVAEADLRVYDTAKAWGAFQEGLAVITPLQIAWELFNTMRAACDGELGGEHGIVLDLQSKPPELVIVREAIR